MTFDPNDPRLTAYVLGEIEPSERPEIEAMLEQSPEARQAVEEIRQTIGWLSDRLHDEQETYATRPGSDHRPAVALAKAGVEPHRPWWRRTAARLVAVAALLLIAGSVTLLSVLRTSRPQYAAYSVKAKVPARTPQIVFGPQA